MVEDEKVMMEEKKDETATVADAPSAESDEKMNVLDAEEVVSPDDLPDVSSEEGSGEEVPQESDPTISVDTTFADADILSGSDDGQSDAAVSALQQQIESLTAELDERNSQYKRIAADFENFRRRTQREKADLENQVKSDTISDLLPVIDNFERARSQIKPQTDSEMNIHKSYQGVYKQLVDCLKRVGVSPMRAEGEMFDPNLHNAVMREPTSEHEEGIVIEDLMRGYILGDRVLRHAMVKVAAAPDSSATEQSEEVEESGGAG